MRYREAHHAGMQHFLNSGTGPVLNKRVELLGLRKNGEEFPVELTINAIKSTPEIEFCAFLHDITDRKQAEEHLQEMAQIDQLTGLPNRRLFFDRISSAMDRAQRQKKLMAVIYLDIDHFKEVNDKNGHGVGDFLLSEVASRLRNSVRQTDTVARLGGDEFVIIIENLQQHTDADDVINKITQNLNRDVVIGSLVCNVTVSMGGAFYSGGDLPHTQLIGLADEALYKAKQSGRNQSCWAQS